MSGAGVAVSALDVAVTRGTVEEHFPGLWPAVEVGLSVCATLWKRRVECDQIPPNT
jgi:hypothetical protein